MKKTETPPKNRIDETFASKENDILNVYFTAGYPRLEDTLRIAASLENAGVDMIEIGIPYSDPIADGPTIQMSSEHALKNGMSIKVLFDQLSSLRDQVTVPVILMGYLNPIIQFGIENFCRKCVAVGVDGIIVPDLPMTDFLTSYKEFFERHGIYNIFLITPQTSEERIRLIDTHTSGFIYVVSSSSITGAKGALSEDQIQYFERIAGLRLQSRLMIGFGISDGNSFHTACTHASGAIVGSAFIRQLDKDPTDKAILKFIHSIKQPAP